jgi:two-component system, OmpR family, KDP operon response regulator KdpE
VKILIADDNPDLVESLTLGFRLQWAECQVVAAGTGRATVALFQAQHPDVILLDIGLPEMDGFEVLKRIREESDVPILMLTVRSEELDKVKALELGADDYIVKPFSSLELLARIKAVLRRAEASMPAPATPAFVSSALTIDYDSRKVIVHGQPVELTPTEYKLLCALARYPDQTVSREALLARVWGSEYRGETDFLKVYIKRLRTKVEENPSLPQLILTERGMGYKLIRNS